MPSNVFADIGTVFNFLVMANTRVNRVYQNLSKLRRLTTNLIRETGPALPYAADALLVGTR